ncbi:MAG: hypothetical protein IKO99_02800 [Bacteroidales bacterium]|nr:hypothetical protein [Bacteroidales bacterium]
MKDFLVKVVVPVMAVVIGLLITVELIARNKSTDSYKIKSEYLEQHAEEIELLVLGPSGAGFGIKPDELDKKSFNCAGLMQSLLYDHHIFKKYFNRFRSLKYLVLDINFIGLHVNRICPGYDGESKIIHYSIHFDAPFYKKNFWDYKLKVQKNLLSLRKEEIPECDENGFLTFYPNGKDFKVEAANTANYYNEMVKRTPDSVYKDNLLLLEEILTICKSRGIKVIILTFPTVYISEFINPEYYSEMQQSLSDLQEKYDFVYENYTDSNLFELSDFYNANHLNPRGAVKLTRMLNDSIRKWEGR